MANWPTEPVSLSRTSAVSDLLAKRGLRGFNIRIEIRHRRRLCFSFRCPCGREFDTETDDGGDADFAIEAAWPRRHRQCRRPEPVEYAIPQPAGPVRKATAAQLRLLWRDPTVREAIKAFTVPARRFGEPSIPNVIGAIFPDGAVFRSYADDEKLVWIEPGNSPYPPGFMPKAAKANWGERSGRKR